MPLSQTPPIVGPSSGPDWWAKGKTGHLPPWGQAVVWAALKLNEALDLKMTDSAIAELVTKSGSTEHPAKCAIKKWRDIMASDPHWYPNKTQEDRARPGPTRLRTEEKEESMASTAMTIKDSGLEPTVALVKERNHEACTNPSTGELFTDKYILEVFKRRCHDHGSDLPWGHLYPLSKTALPDWLKANRVSWAKAQLDEGKPAGWYYRHVVWVDPCYNILSTSARQIFDIEKAAGGKRKRWQSPDCKAYSRNLPASRYAGHQKQNGDRKLWWFIVLARGNVHIEVVGGDWQQTGVGMAEFVDRLPPILHAMLGNDAALPRVVASVRGPGFFQSSTGHIVKAYSAALQKNGFRPFAGEDASKQPPDCPDVLLHESAVGWIRNYLRKHPFDRSGSLDVQEARLRQLFKDCTCSLFKV